MSTTTKNLKALLHESIENIEDESLLRVAKNILDRTYSPDENLILHQDRIQRLEKAKSSLSKGEYLSNEQADQLVSEWLEM